MFAVSIATLLLAPVHDTDALAARLDRIVQPALGKPAPGVAVTVVHGGEVVWFRGYGVADKEEGGAITQDTMFAVCSISKSVSAWGFLRLVEQGRIELDDPVLEHVKGGAPGAGYRYSGGGTSVAQLLYERLTGEDFVASSRDFARFAIACLPDHRPAEAEEILSRASLLEMLARSGEAPNAGLGFLHKPIAGLATVGHTGGDLGWTSTLRLVPERGDALIVLQNCFESIDLYLAIEGVWARWVQGR